MVCCGQSVICCHFCWYNHFGAFSGISLACMCFSCLCFGPAQMTYIRGEDVCNTKCNQGCGHSCVCSGHYCCVPDWLKKWSIWHTIGNVRGKMFDVQIIDTVPVKKGMENKALMEMNSSTPRYT